MGRARHGETGTDRPRAGAPDHEPRLGGDTRWPFYSQLLGTVGLAIPLAYVGATSVTLPAVAVPLLGIAIDGATVPAIGILGLYLAFLAETTVPAAITYYRFATGRWKAFGREYRPEPVADD